MDWRIKFSCSKIRSRNGCLWPEAPEKCPSREIDGPGCGFYNPKAHPEYIKEKDNDNESTEPNSMEECSPEE